MSANKQLVKNNKLLDAQNVLKIIKSKSFSGQQNVSPDNVFLFQTLHTTPRRHFSLTQAVILLGLISEIKTMFSWIIEWWWCSHSARWLPCQRNWVLADHAYHVINQSSTVLRSNNIYHSWLFRFLDWQLTF